MRRLPTILILLTITLPTFGQVSADNPTDNYDRKNFLYLNPLPFVNNTFQINYERLLSKKTGLLFSSGYTLVDSYDDGKKGGNGEIHLRIYLSDMENKTRRLFYFSPYARFQYIESTLGYYEWDKANRKYYFVDQPDSYVSSYSGGLLIGFKWITKTRLTIDAYLGGGMQLSKLNGKNIISSGFGDYYGYYTGTIPKIGVQFGYDF